MASTRYAEAAPLLVGAEGNATLERTPLTPVGRREYDQAWLQRPIHQHPARLPIAEIEPALDSFSSVCCEMPTRRGFIDNLLMTGRGTLPRSGNCTLYKNGQPLRLSTVLDRLNNCLAPIQRFISAMAKQDEGS